MKPFPKPSNSLIFRLGDGSPTARSGIVASILLNPNKSNEGVHEHVTAEVVTERVQAIHEHRRGGPWWDRAFNLRDLTLPACLPRGMSNLLQ